MIVIYKTMPPKEIRKTAKESIPQIEQWFRDHPHKKICKTQAWYGKMIEVHRGHVHEEVMAAAKEAIANDNTKGKKATLS